MPRIAMLLLLPLLFSTSCLTMIDDPLGRRTAFAQSQREYTRYVRWGDLESAADFVDSGGGQARGENAAFLAAPGRSRR